MYTCVCICRRLFIISSLYNSYITLHRSRNSWPDRMMHHAIHSLGFAIFLYSGFWVLGVGLGFRVLRFKVLGFGVLGFRVLGLLGFEGLRDLGLGSFGPWHGRGARSTIRLIEGRLGDYYRYY